MLSNQKKFCLTTLFAVALWGFAVPATASETLPLDEAALKAAENNIRNAEADLKSAKSSAGTAAKPAKGSRLKLTKMRVESATSRLDAAAKALAKLPAKGAKVTPLRARYGAAVATVAEIEAILSGGGKPKKETPPGKTPKTGSPPPGKPAPKKLDYKQEKTLKDARWYVREVDKYCASAAVVVARIDGEGEPAVHSDVKAGLASLDRAWEKFKLVEGYLGALPSDHPQVAPTIKAAKDAKSTLGALSSRLKAKDAELDKLTNLANYPNYDQDFQKLQDFGRRYTNFGGISQQPEQLARLISEDRAVMGELQRLAKLYLPLAEQKTEAGQRIESLFLNFQSNREAFAKKLLELKATLPAAFEKELAEAEKLAKEAVEKNRPGYFGEHSGINQRLNFAEDKLRLLVAFDADAAKPYEARLAETRAAMKLRAKSLEKQIIAQNTLPPDLYRGEDRADLERRAREAWIKSQPDAQILAVRIPAKAWKRTTRWQHGGELNFYKVDTSRIQVQLILKHDSELAVMRPINLVKDHLASDTIQSYPMDTIKDELSPHRYLPLTKLPAAKN